VVRLCLFYCSCHKPYYNKCYLNISKKQLDCGDIVDKKLIGMVSHYYPKISVAVVDLTDALKVGDKISIERGNEISEQVVTEMQVEHRNIKEAKKGQSVGMRMYSKTKEGARVYKIID